MYAASSDPLAPVIHQHSEESACLQAIRSGHVSGPHVKLHHLQRLDDRLAAHLDGVAVAGEFGWKLCETALVNPGIGEVFTATIRAIEEKNSEKLDKLLALAEIARPPRAGIISAFGWASVQYLQGTVAKLLTSTEPFRREVGIAACAMHRADPGRAVNSAIRDSDASLRARGLRVAGEAGRHDLLPDCITALTDENIDCRFWAAHSAVLLGDRYKAANALKDIALNEGRHRVRALQLLLKVISLPQANEFLKLIASNPANKRLLIQGAGISGDPYYIPWLIKQMDDLKLARLAGESFSFVTGLDLAYLDLERKPPEGVEFGPNDNPEDDNVAMDEDDSLPWPDPTKIQAWWGANKSRFTNGQRYFMGAPVTREHCLQVLKEGYQRQRIAAAQYLCLLEPGTKLFPTSAPAWRQQRWLAKMG